MPQAPLPSPELSLPYRSTGEKPLNQGQQQLDLQQRERLKSQLQRCYPAQTSKPQTTRQTSETDASEPRSNSLATNTLPSVNTDLHHPWGKLLRGASVHSAPSIASAILGYGAAGTPMRLVKRELGWVRVRDPATSREGWIHEEHITVESPNATRAELAPGDALASEDPEVSEQPARSFKSKKPRKAHKAKKSRKTYASKQWSPTRFGRRAYRGCTAWSEGFCVQNY